MEQAPGRGGTGREGKRMRGNKAQKYGKGNTDICLVGVRERALRPRGEGVCCPGAAVHKVPGKRRSPVQRVPPLRTPALRSAVHAPCVRPRRCQGDETAPTGHSIHRRSPAAWENTSVRPSADGAEPEGGGAKDFRVLDRHTRGRREQSGTHGPPLLPAPAPTAGPSGLASGARPLPATPAARAMGSPPLCQCIGEGGRTPKRLHGRSPPRSGHPCPDPNGAALPLPRPPPPAPRPQDTHAPCVRTAPPPPPRERGHTVPPPPPIPQGARGGVSLSTSAPTPPRLRGAAARASVKASGAGNTDAHLLQTVWESTVTAATSSEGPSTRHRAHSPADRPSEDGGRGVIRPPLKNIWKWPCPRATSSGPIPGPPRWPTAFWVWKRLTSLVTTAMGLASGARGRRATSPTLAHPHCTYPSEASPCLGTCRLLR